MSNFVCRLSHNGKKWRLSEFVQHIITFYDEEMFTQQKVEVTLSCMIIWLPIYMKKKRIMITTNWKIGIWQAWELKGNWE